MLAYQKTLKEFYDDIRQNIIADEILKKLPINVSPSEINSYESSLPAIAAALQNVNIDLNAEVALEFKIPLTNMRVDFMIAGADKNNVDHLVIVELKQWDKVSHTDMSDIVLVGNEQHVHPSWQSYTYGSTISNFNQYVESSGLKIVTCTFLHKYKRNFEDELCNQVYEEGLLKAPPFIKDEFVSLAEFINKYVCKASSHEILFELDNGRIRPSKMLVDSLTNMLQGNKEYELLDNQRIVFSNLYYATSHLNIVKSPQKHVFIVKGGAGTGKSVIAIQLLGELIKNKGLKAFYVSKSSYVRDNYFAKLTRNIPNYKFLRTLFKGSSSFIDSIKNEFDVLIVDEAHRLTERTKQSWFYKGTNQIQEIIHASKVSIFFIDETQNIDIKDYGSIDHIKQCAKEENAIVHEDKAFELTSQFRCNGSDEYISWLNSILYNKPFISSGTPVDYDIQVFDDLMKMKEAIVCQNQKGKLPSRMLSGDVFPWKSMKNKNDIDIQIGDFSAFWNKTKAFATDPSSIDEVGCIHTSQGMEFEYAGIIIGSDFIYRNSKIITDYSKHPSGASEFKRPNRRMIDPADKNIIDMLIRNTYKVLLTRGQKGSFIYCMDKELSAYLKKQIDILKNNGY
jgi:DUF2075 family protein